MQGAYAPITGAGIFGTDTPAAYGTVIPFPAGVAAQPTDPGSGTVMGISTEFRRSAGFGLLLLVALVIYFDLRLLNR